MDNIKMILEGLLFICGDEGLSLEMAANALNIDIETCEKEFDELQRDVHAIDVGVEIKDIHLNGEALAIVECGSDTHIHHPLVPLPCHLHHHRVGALVGQNQFRSPFAHICGGKTDTPAIVKTVHHLALQRVGPAHAAHGIVHLARGNEATTNRRTHRGVFAQIFRCLEHIDAQILAMLHIVGKRFIGVVAKAMVVAHHQHRHTIAVAQQLEELPRSVARKRKCEIQQHRHINAMAFDLSHLIVGGEQHFDVGIRPKHRLRVLGEGNDRRLQMPFARNAFHLIDERDMAQVHPVKHADGGNRAPARQAIVVGNQLHSTIWFCFNTSINSSPSFTNAT